MVPYLRAPRLPTCRQPAAAVYSWLGKMRAPLAGRGGLRWPRELAARALRVGWKAMYSRGLKRKNPTNPEEVRGWLFLSATGSSVLSIKWSGLQVL